MITSELVYKIKGDTQGVYCVPTETTKAVDDFVMLERCRRERAREASYMYSGDLYYSIAPALEVQGRCSVGCHPAKTIPVLRFVKSKLSRFLDVRENTCYNSSVYWQTQSEDSCRQEITIILPAHTVPVPSPVNLTCIVRVRTRVRTRAQT